MIQRRILECLTCGRKTIIRTAAGHDDYQEFAFPCGGCGLEIRYGMELPLNKRMRRVWAIKDEQLRKREMERVFKMKAKTIKYVNVHNLKWCKEEVGITDIKTFDGETLNPISGNYFSPFMATAFLPKDFEMFRRHQSVRSNMATR